MNYDLDMPPYIEDMAKWLDDDSAVHPCNGEEAYKGFEIMMGICRSATNGGQIALPLDDGPDEIEELERAMLDTPVLLSMPENRKEYPE